LVEHSTENAGVVGSIPSLGIFYFWRKSFKKALLWYTESDGEGRYYVRQGEKSMAIQHDEHQKKISLEEFFALVESDSEHRYELIDGYPYMMTGGSPDHSIICNNLGRILGNLLQKRPRIVYNSDVYVQLANEDCICPDVSVSCDRRDRHATRAIQHPCLVAEVLSPRTKVRDRGLKAELYQDIPTVQEILLIDTQVMRIQLYQREGDHWIKRNFTHDDTVVLSCLGTPISVVEVYEKTTFDDSFAEE
jgi:Uma2 family endonuclease